MPNQYDSHALPHAFQVDLCLFLYLHSKIIISACIMHIERNKNKYKSDLYSCCHLCLVSSVMPISIFVEDIVKRNLSYIQSQASLHTFLPYCLMSPYNIFIRMSLKSTIDCPIFKAGLFHYRHSAWKGLIKVSCTRTEIYLLSQLSLFHKPYCFHTITTTTSLFLKK